MKVRCRTNLDLFGEVFPDELETLPRVGDRIESATQWKIPDGNSYTQITLEVCAILWKCVSGDEIVRTSGVTGYRMAKWVPEIELHLPTNGQFLHISHFDLWYEYIRGHCSKEHYQATSQKMYKRSWEEKAR